MKLLTLLFLHEKQISARQCLVELQDVIRGIHIEPAVSLSDTSAKLKMIHHNIRRQQPLIEHIKPDFQSKMCSWTNLAILAATAIPAANGFQGSGHYYASKTSQLLGRTYSGRIAFANSDGEHSIRQRRTQLHLFGNFFNRDKNSDDAEAEIKKEGGDRKLKVPFFAEVKTEKVAVVDEVNLVSAEEDFGGDVQTLVKEEPEKPKPKPKLSPREQAELLKQQAARIRLEGT